MSTLSHPGTLPSLEALKAQAKDLRSKQDRRSSHITHSQALEAVAKQWGYRNWNTLCAAAKRAAPMQWQVGQRVTGRYLGHPISGYLKAVDAKFGGFTRVTVVFDDAIDVVESTQFSAFRKQVNAQLTPAGKTHGRLSDGTPHLELKPA